jgi:hypothetical protein
MLLEMITGRGEINVWPLGLLRRGPEVIWNLPYPGEI